MTSFKQHKIEMQTNMSKVIKEAAHLKNTQGEHQIDEKLPDSLVRRFSNLTSSLPASQLVHSVIFPIPDNQSSVPAILTMPPPTTVTMPPLVTHYKTYTNCATIPTPPFARPQGRLVNP